MWTRVGRRRRSCALAAGETVEAWRVARLAAEAAAMTRGAMVARRAEAARVAAAPAPLPVMVTTVGLLHTDPLGPSGAIWAAPATPHDRCHWFSWHTNAERPAARPLRGAVTGEH